MSNPSKYQISVLAAGVVDGATGNLLAGGVGCGVTKVGVGVYNITLCDEAPKGECVMIGTVVDGGVHGGIVGAHLSNTVKQFDTYSLAVAADHSFEFIIFRTFNGH